MDDERMRTLEERAAYQEQRIASLDDVVREFADRVQSLERELATIREAITTGSEIINGDKPPHY